MSQARHIAKNGVKRGEWVACNARIRCQNGGVHVDVASLYRARDLILETTGTHYTAISRIPLEDLRKVLHPHEIRPNNLPAARQPVAVGKTQEEPTRIVKRTPSVPKIKKHFNEGSSFIEIVQSAYGQNEYSVHYPLTRVIKFDKLSDEDFQETVAYLKQAGSRWNRLNYRVVKRSIRIDIASEDQLKLWVPAETHSFLAWLKLDAKLKSKKGKYPEHYETYNQEKSFILDLFKKIGVKELID